MATIFAHDTRMQNALLDSFTLVDSSGQVIITSIVLSLLAAVGVNVGLRARFASIDRELAQNPKGASSRYEVIDRTLRQARDAARHGGGLVNTQGIVEQNFQSELGLLLLGERFVRAAPGLMIILGLIGTFYGLTLAIGKLVGLIASQAPEDAGLAQALTQGLTQSLSGMSVAFTTSLFGVVASVVLMLFGIFSNVTDRRTALMVKVENFADRVLAAEGLAGGSEDARLERTVAGFGESVARLEEAVTRFDMALQTFSTTTRDFREFNLHLKDNVQRMSLSFGDFSEAMRSQIGALQAQRRS